MWAVIDSACVLPVQYFNDMDNLYEHACELESAIEIAVHGEQFEEAAKLKLQYDDLRKKDVVDAVLSVSHLLLTCFMKHLARWLFVWMVFGWCSFLIVSELSRKSLGGGIFISNCPPKKVSNWWVQELNTAVENEDYATAAELRDTGCAGLIGWWQARAENDPCGHLLRIAPDFGRYTAIMYTPRDFAEVKVRLSDLAGGLLLNSRLCSCLWTALKTLDGL